MTILQTSRDSQLIYSNALSVINQRVQKSTNHQLVHCVYNDYWSCLTNGKSTLLVHVFHSSWTYSMYSIGNMTLTQYLMRQILLCNHIIVQRCVYNLPATCHPANFFWMHWPINSSMNSKWVQGVCPLYHPVFGQQCLRLYSSRRLDIGKLYYSGITKQCDHSPLSLSVSLQPVWLALVVL